MTRKGKWNPTLLMLPLVPTRRYFSGMLYQPAESSAAPTLSVGYVTFKTSVTFSIQHLGGPIVRLRMYSTQKVETT